MATACYGNRPRWLKIIKGLRHRHGLHPGKTPKQEKEGLRRKAHACAASPALV